MMQNHNTPTPIQTIEINIKGVKRSSLMIRAYIRVVEDTMWKLLYAIYAINKTFKWEIEKSVLYAIN